MLLDPRARRYFDEGAGAYMRRDYKKSAADFSRAIKIDRDFAPGYVYRGSAYLKLGSLARAMADFEKAVALDADFALAYHMRALVHEKRGNFAEAYRDFDRALHLDPYCSSAYCGRSSILSGQQAACNEDADIIQHLNTVRLQPGALS